jgi:hypothetical protein
MPVLRVRPRPPCVWAGSPVSADDGIRRALPQRLLRRTPGAVFGTEDRILLTRDAGLLKRNAVTRGYYVRETSPRRQLEEVLRRFDLLRLAETTRSGRSTR